MLYNSLHTQIVNDIVSRSYNNPLMLNIHRGIYAEYLVLSALGEPWELVGGWNIWDMQNRTTGVRLEVKQSARLQTWSEKYGSQGTENPSFDDKPRAGYYDSNCEDAKWVDLPERVRSADIYVFAWHPESDHRDTRQWQFYAVPEFFLPPKQKTISLGRLKKLAKPVRYDQLGAEVEKVSSRLPCLKVRVNVNERARKCLKVAQHHATYFPDRDVKLAIARLTNLALRNGAQIVKRSGSIVVQKRCSIWPRPLSLVWMFGPEVTGWSNSQEVVIQAGNGRADFFENLPPRLRQTLEAWVEQFSSDTFTTPAETTGWKACWMTHQAAAANIDLLCERLDRVLRELAELQPEEG